MPAPSPKDIYPELDPLQLALRCYALQVAAMRMRRFGFEHGINNYGPRELRAMAMMMPFGAEALLAEADAKEAAHVA